VRLNASKSSPASFDDWWIDTRLIAPMRLVLAATALLIIYVDPSQPDRLERLTYSLLIGYTAYSGLILLLALAAPRKLPATALHWFDLIWYVALISVSSGTNSIFFLFFFFAILVASFRFGFVSGLMTTAAAAVLFVTLGYLTAPGEPDFELNRFLLRAVTLGVLGYMIAHWGASEIELKRRLRLLKDVTNLANPRFGIEQTIILGLERLREFYDAQACICVYTLRLPEDYRLARVDRGKSEPAPSTKIAAELAQLLLGAAPDTAVMRTGRSAAILLDIKSQKIRRDNSTQISTIANTLMAERFTSIPISYRGAFIGRLYIVNSKRRRVSQSDVEFILQLIDHVNPLLDNIRLLDRLASEAADQERKKVARDIHDSIIQPYVGLQLGLAAVRQTILAENSSALSAVTELCEVANNEVRGLRIYLDELKAANIEEGVLFPAMRRLAANYTAATGIDVTLHGDPNLRLNDRLAAEVFQMIREALSNIRRHTSAEKAEVEILCDKRDLTLKISNEQNNGHGSPDFRPKSIAERVSALGGHTAVYADEANRTVVAIFIPL